MWTSIRALALGAVILLVLRGSSGVKLYAQSESLTTKDLTDRAEVVAVGKVSSVKSEWNADRTRITTRVTITVREYLKGGGIDKQLVVLTPGGEVGEVGEWYSGAARFRKEEDVVVFARKREGREHEMSGGAQGRVPVVKDRRTGESFVGRSIRLDDFRAQVRSAAQAVRPGERRP